MIALWIAAAVFFAVVEAATVGLVSIWFTIGAIAALAAALLNFALWVQIVIFFIVSAVAIILTKPLVNKYVTPRKKPTNADRLFTMIGLVTEEIDNIANKGTVSISGQTWSARSKNGEKIAVGEEVRPVSIEGVKLIVVKVKKAETAQK